MGQHANARAWAEFERLDRIKQEQSFEAEPPLTEEEKAALWDDAYWERLDAVMRYSLPMRHVRVWDEVEVGR
ncbi:hypothetical protein [Paraburkholderia graminis]|uniref:hypothetical protein n=1 Tax=Paraburkholderia graminis TaxID=60548 RepID=UPI0038BA1855